MVTSKLFQIAVQLFNIVAVFNKQSHSTKLPELMSKDSIDAVKFGVQKSTSTEPVNVVVQIEVFGHNKLVLVVIVCG
jgi:hypothetical protein